MIIFPDHMLLTLLSEILLIIHTCIREYHWPISSTASLEETPVKSVKLLSWQQYHINNCFHVRLKSTTTGLLVQKLIRTKNATPAPIIAPLCWESNGNWGFPKYWVSNGQRVSVTAEFTMLLHHLNRDQSYSK